MIGLFSQAGLNDTTLTKKKQEEDEKTKVKRIAKTKNYLNRKKLNGEILALTRQNKGPNGNDGRKALTGRRKYQGEAVVNWQR